MVGINAAYDNLPTSYLFSEIARRTRAFTAAHPELKVLRLGIGNTTEALPPTLIEALHHGVNLLSSRETYTGYGDEQGNSKLRKAIADSYLARNIKLDPLEVFVSDGAKSDLGNLTTIFGPGIVAVQDPVYPAYVDTTIISGRAGASFNGILEDLVYLVCNEKNGFFPSLPERADIIYLCYPNNPTGATATKEQLKTFVDFAIRNKSVIIFDAAYSAFIQDTNLPRSIYEIEGADKCAIEVNSFSKSAGFTGVRLGWTVVPKTLVVDRAEPGKVNSLWNRRQTTFFNGASNIPQEGGLVVLTEQGQRECQAIIDYYLENARIIRTGLLDLGITSFGGENAPYIWMKTPYGMKSWDFFDKLLEETHVVGTPGVGFGPSGEGHFRLSAFGHRENIEAAVDSIRKNLRL